MGTAGCVKMLSWAKQGVPNGLKTRFFATLRNLHVLPTPR